MIFYLQALDSEPLLIDALIDDCKFLLEDWEAWTDILLKQKLRDNKALIVTKMLAACIWITATGYVPVSRAVSYNNYIFCGLYKVFY